MKIRVLLVAALLISVAFSVPTVEKSITPKKKIALFNGKDMSGWDYYLKGEAKFADTWSVKEGVIHCKGKPNGYIKTKKRYSNYKLHVEWRWVGKAGNSGVLLHMDGPDKVWPKCIEAQLKSGNAGDFYLIGGTDIKEKERRKGIHVKKMAESSEKPLGQWNKYDILCKGGIIELRVNGVLQNKASKASVTAGLICLQSEGVPIEFRNVYLEPVGKK
jgi:3-keto-disaccharide hydrolase